MRAREVNERLSGKVDPIQLAVLEGLAEDNSVLRQQILSLAEIVDGLINQNAQLMNTISAAQSAVDKIRGKEWQGDLLDD
jgi:hypothetical protein